MRSAFQRWVARIVLIVPFAVFLYSPSAAWAGPPGSADGFEVPGALTVTNSRSTRISGDLGLSPGASITGLDGIAFAGTVHQSDGTALQARLDAATAHQSFALLSFARELTGQVLGGLALTPGVDRFSSSARLTGSLTLDASSSANNALSVLQAGGALRTASGSAVRRIGGENNRMSWQVGSSATLEPGTGTEAGLGLLEDVPKPRTVSLFCVGLLALTLYAWQSRKRLV